VVLHEVVQFGMMFGAEINVARNYELQQGRVVGLTISRISPLKGACQ